MSNAEKIQNFKRSIKIPTKSDIQDSKGFWILTGLLAVGLFALIIFWMVGGNKPQSYEDILPQMDRAFEFEEQAYAPIQDFEENRLNLSDTEQLRALKKDYKMAANVQQIVINDINYMDDVVAASGGITTYEDLQKLKTLPATNSLIAENIESDLKAYGVNQRKERPTADDITKALDKVYTVKTDSFGRIQSDID